ncbi:hypothetical protein Sjap_001402 [Stephania japonica]|uniref:Uncharacterized protein n=1 Tax=Stephania japonica TaxID=461633 RepID=A0AAP0PRM8_9MAGN
MHDNSTLDRLNPVKVHYYERKLMHNLWFSSTIFFSPMCYPCCRVQFCSLALLQQYLPSMLKRCEL